MTVEKSLNNLQKYADFILSAIFNPKFPDFYIHVHVLLYNVIIVYDNAKIIENVEQMII